MVEVKKVAEKRPKPLVAHGIVRVKMLETVTGSKADGTESMLYEKDKEYDLPTGPHPKPDVGAAFLALGHAELVDEDDQNQYERLLAKAEAAAAAVVVPPTDDEIKKAEDRKAQLTADAKKAEADAAANLKARADAEIVAAAKAKAEADAAAAAKK